MTSQDLCDREWGCDWVSVGVFWARSLSRYLDRSRRPIAHSLTPLVATLFQATVEGFATSSLVREEQTGRTTAVIIGAMAPNPAQVLLRMFHRPGLALNVTQAKSHICKATTLFAAPDPGAQSQGRLRTQWRITITNRTVIDARLVVSPAAAAGSDAMCHSVK